VNSIGSQLIGFRTTKECEDAKNIRSIEFIYESMDEDVCQNALTDLSHMSEEVGGQTTCPEILVKEEAVTAEDSLLTRDGVRDEIPRDLKVYQMMVGLVFCCVIWACAGTVAYVAYKVKSSRKRTLMREQGAENAEKPPIAHQRVSELS